MNTVERVFGELSRVAQSPTVLRGVSHIMRRASPVLKLGDAVFVFDYQDVIETLASDADFGVTPAYAEKMDRTSGDFFLGMEAGPRYEQEERFCQQAYRPADTERVRALITETGRALLDERGDGPLDFVKDYANVIPLVLVDRYFGVPGPSKAVMQRWMFALFWDLFLNLTNEREVSERAVAAGQELRPYLLQRINEIRARGEEDTFLGRMVAAQHRGDGGMDDDGLVRNIGGILIGAVATQAKAMTLALQELLCRPDALAEAQRAAREGDDEALSGYIFEALRFNPHNPLILRHAMRPAVVAPGTTRALTVPTGTRVFAMTISASFDSKGFTDPETFNPRRPYNDYLHFGYGMHRCFGAQLVKTVVTAALREVLRRDGISSIQPAWRAVQYQGPFPDRFDVQFLSAPAGRAARLWSFSGLSRRHENRRAN